MCACKYSWITILFVVHFFPRMVLGSFVVCCSMPWSCHLDKLYVCSRLSECDCCASADSISSNLNIFSFKHRIALQYLLLPVVLFKTFASNLEHIWTTTTMIAKSGNRTATAHTHTHIQFPEKVSGQQREKWMTSKQPFAISNGVCVCECTHSKRLWHLKTGIIITIIIIIIV